MSGRLSCKRRAVDAAAAASEGLASREELDFTDDFCEPSVAFRAPKKPKYSRRAAAKSSEQNRSLRSVSSSFPSKSFSRADKENVNLVSSEKSSKPVAVVYTIDDDDDDNDDVPLSPAKQAVKLVTGAGRLVPKVNCDDRKSSRSCKESLSSRLTRSLPSLVSNKDTEFDVPDNAPTLDRASASSSQLSCTSSLQDASTSRYFKPTRSRTATSQKAGPRSTENRSSPVVAQDSCQEAQVSVSENDRSEDDFSGLPSTADDPELADIEKSICGVDERLCPCCKHIVASANYGVHLRKCFKRFQWQSRLLTDSSSSGRTRQSRVKSYTAGSVNPGPSNSKAAPTEPEPSTSRSSSAGQSIVDVDRPHFEVTLQSADAAGPPRMLLNGASGGILQFEGQDETEQDLFLKPLQNQPCMVRVRRGGAAAVKGDVQKARRGRKKKTASLTALQTTSTEQRTDFVQRRLELIKAWRPNSGEFEKVTRGSKKLGQQRLCEAVSLCVAKDKPLWSLPSQTLQDVTRYYVAELAPHVVPPAESCDSNITLHRALSQIPGRLNITHNLNLDSDDEDYQHPLDHQNSFVSGSLSETQRVLADLLRSQASMFLDGTVLDSAPSPSAPSPRAPSPRAPSPSAPSPRAPSPRAPSPSAPSPSAPSPSAPSPRAPSPSAPSPRAPSPSAPSPSAPSPSAPSPRAPSPSASSPSAPPQTKVLSAENELPDITDNSSSSVAGFEKSLKNCTVLLKRTPVKDTFLCGSESVRRTSKNECHTNSKSVNRKKSLDSSCNVDVLHDSPGSENCGNSLACAESERLHYQESANNVTTCRDVELNDSKASVSSPCFDNSLRVSVSPDILRTLKPIRIELTRLADTSSGLQLHSQLDASIPKKSPKILFNVLQDTSSRVGVDVLSLTESAGIKAYDLLESKSTKLAKNMESHDHEAIIREELKGDYSSTSNPIVGCDTNDVGDGSTQSFDISEHEPCGSGPTQSFQDMYLDPDDCSVRVDGVKKDMKTRVSSSNECDSLAKRNIISNSEKNGGEPDADNKNALDGVQDALPMKTGLSCKKADGSVAMPLSIGKSVCSNISETEKPTALSDCESKNFLRHSKNSVDNKAIQNLSYGGVRSVDCVDLKSDVESVNLHSRTTEVYDDQANGFPCSKNVTSCATIPCTSIQSPSKCRKVVVSPDQSLLSPDKSSRLNIRNILLKHSMSSTHELITKPLVTPVRNTDGKIPLHVPKLPSLTEISENKTENQCRKDGLPEETNDVANVRAEKHCTFFKNITSVPDSDASDEDVPASLVRSSQVPNKFKERTLSNFSVENVSKLNSYLNDSDVVTTEFRDLNLQRYFFSLPKHGFDKISSPITVESAAAPEVCEVPALESSMKLKVNEDFRKLLETGACADATITLDKGSIPVHSLVLFARSPPLHNELMSLSKSKRNLKWSVSFECAKQFLRYIYSGTVGIESTGKDLLEMYKLSIKYECEDLSNYLLKLYPHLSVSAKTTIFHDEQEPTVVSPSPEIESVVSSTTKINCDLLKKQVSGFRPERNASSDAIDEIMSLPSLYNEKYTGNRMSTSLCENVESVSQCVNNPSPTPPPIRVETGICVQDLPNEKFIPMSASNTLTSGVSAKSKQNVDVCATEVTTLEDLEADVSRQRKSRSRSPDLFDDLSEEMKDVHVPRADAASRSNEDLRDKTQQTKSVTDLSSINNYDCDVASVNSKLTSHSIRPDEVNKREVIDITHSDSGGSQESRKSLPNKSNENLPSACEKSIHNEIGLQPLLLEFKDGKSSETETSRFTERYNQSTDVESAHESRAASSYLSNVWDDFEGGNDYGMGDISLTPVKPAGKSYASLQNDSSLKAAAVDTDPQLSLTHTRRDFQGHLGLNSTAIDHQNDKQPNFSDASIVPAVVDSVKSSAFGSTLPSSAKRRLCNEALQKYNDLDFYSDNDCDMLSEIELDALENNTSLNTRLLRRKENSVSHVGCDSELSSSCENEGRRKQIPKNYLSSGNGVQTTQLLSKKVDTYNSTSSSLIIDKFHRRKKPFTFKAPEGSSFVSTNKRSSRGAGAALHQRVNQLRKSPAPSCLTTRGATAATPPPAASPKTPQSADTPITPRPDYSNMASPELKKALDDFGVRPLAKAKARALLKHIYHQTHPVVGTPASSAPDRSRTDVYTSTPVGRSRAGAHRAKTGTGSQAQFTAAGVSHSARPCGEDSSQPKVVDLSLSDDADEGCAEESMLLSQNDSDGDVDSPQEKGSIHERLRSLISSERSLYEAVLLYQPVWLHHLKQLAVAAGIKCSMATLVDFLDQQCITFRMGAPGQGSASRTRKKPKKRKLPVKL